MKEDKKIPRMILFNQDGSTSVILRRETDQREIRVTPSGVTIMELSTDRSETNTGFCFGGDSIFISNFKDKLPHGESILFNTSSNKSDTSSSGSRAWKFRAYDGRTASIVQDFTEGLDRAYAQSFMDEISIECSHSCLTWSDLIDPRFMLGTLSSYGSLFLYGRRYELGRIGSREVLLSRLPDRPPGGFVEIASTIRVRQAELWRKRFERFMEISDYPSNILIPLGIASLGNDSFYVVSELPALLHSDQILSDLPGPLEDWHDDCLETLQSITECVKFVHRKGASFEGRLNPRAFIYSSGGSVWLNTTYILSRPNDPSQLLGGFDSYELRFLCPSSVPQLSSRTRFLMQSDNGSVGSSKIHHLETDTYQLGLTILTLSSGTDTPFKWLTTSQFFASCLVHSLVPTRWLSPLFRPPADPTSTNVNLKDLGEATRFEELGVSMMNGDLSIDRLSESLSIYLESGMESSSESNVRTMFNKVSASVLQSSSLRQLGKAFNL